MNNTANRQTPKFLFMVALNHIYANLFHKRKKQNNDMKQQWQSRKWGQIRSPVAEVGQCVSLQEELQYALTAHSTHSASSALCQQGCRKSADRAARLKHRTPTRHTGAPVPWYISTIVDLLFSGFFSFKMFSWRQNYLVRIRQHTQRVQSGLALGVINNHHFWEELMSGCFGIVL